MVLGYHIFATVHKFFEVNCVRWLLKSPYHALLYEHYT